MTQHKPSTYKDGFRLITFCRICGQEEQELIGDCPGKLVSNAVDKDKSLDKKSEQS